VVKEHFILAVLWMSFCAFHSILASPGIKMKVAEFLKDHFKYYRLYYSIFALVSLVAVLLFLIQIQSFFLFTRTTISYVSGIILCVAGLTVMLICIRKYFAQLSGVKSLYLEEKSSNELMITGIHRYLRHPLYAGTFLFIWGLWLVFPLLSLFITNIIITVYTVAGIHWEEQKLLAEF
jgi:methanethiol S-methyltransferase